MLDAGLAQARDSVIWKYAIEQGMVLVSKDEDFFHLASRPLAGGQFLWVRLGNWRTAHLLSAFERALPSLLERLQAGERVIELR